MTINVQCVTIGYMTKDDVVEGVYLKQTNERYGIPAGLIGVVHQVSIDRTGEWVFVLRYLDHPGARHKKPHSLGSLNLREKDLADFELIGNWISAQALLESGSEFAPLSRKLTSRTFLGLKEPGGSELTVPARLPTKRLARHRAWRKWNINQLRLFEEY